jgi:hypothetical protein
MLDPEAMDWTRGDYGKVLLCDEPRTRLIGITNIDAY